MNGEFWDPFAPRETQELRFPEMAPPAPVEGGVAGADEAAAEPVAMATPPLPEAPWSAMDEPAEVVRFMLFGEPYEAPEPEPEPEPEPPPLPPWSSMEEPAEVVRFMLFGEPYEPPEPETGLEPEPPPFEMSGDREDLPAAWHETEADEVSAAAIGEPPSLPIDAEIEVEVPLVAWPDRSPIEVSAPEPTQEVEAPIYLPGEKPPTLTAITAPRLMVWRGLGIAAGLHVVLLGTLLWMMRARLPAPPPDGPQVALVMETTPQGNTPDPVPTPRVAPPAPAKPARPAPARPLPPPPAPVVTKPADVPLPAPPAPPTTAAPAKTAPPLLIQGSKSPAPRVGSEMVTTNRPAAPDVGNPPPFYPPVARGLGEEGQVDLSVEVLPTGQVGLVRVAKSSGYARLDEAARQSLLSWRFRPAIKNGVPVVSVFTYYVRYQLQ